MHNIHDIKPICNENVFISNMQLIGYPKYITQNYKPTQNKYVSCATFGKGLLLWCP
jgi:hypothetical protein